MKKRKKLLTKHDIIITKFSLIFRVHAPLHENSNKTMRYDITHLLALRKTLAMYKSFAYLLLFIVKLVNLLFSASFATGCTHICHGGINIFNSLVSI